MDFQFVEESLEILARPVEIGPQDPYGDLKLRLPEKFRCRFVSEGHDGVQIEVTFSMNGDKLGIESLTMASSQGQITSTLLQSVSVPHLIQEAVAHVLENYAFWSNGVNESFSQSFSWRENQMLLTKLYWFEYIRQGKPRKRIQELTATNRNGANYIIKNLRELPPVRQ